MELTLHQETDPTPEDIDTFHGILFEHNRQQAGESGFRRLTLLLRDDAGRVMGGLGGETSRGWLFVRTLAVREAFRGQGYGSRLLQTAEQEAITRGCHHAWLDTFSFQARSFYERHGYTVFGALEDYPAGHTRFFLQKALTTQVDS